MSYKTAWRLTDNEAQGEALLALLVVLRFPGFVLLDIAVELIRVVAESGLSGIHVDSYEIEPIARLRVHDRLDGFIARAADGPWGQTLVDPGVVWIIGVLQHGISQL